jgi:ABC-type uncharacterized transport system ATPase subunit
VRFLCIINNGNVVLNGDSGSIRRKMFAHKYKAGYLTEQSFDNKTFIPLQFEKTTDGRFIYTFHAENNQIEALLQQSTQQGGLIYFAEDLPTIHQIFVDTVKA